MNKGVKRAEAMTILGFSNKKLLYDLVEEGIIKKVSSRLYDLSSLIDYRKEMDRQLEGLFDIVMNQITKYPESHDFLVDYLFENNEYEEFDRFFDTTETGLILGRTEIHDGQRVLKEIIKFNEYDIESLKKSVNRDNKIDFLLDREKEGEIKEYEFYKDFLSKRISYIFDEDKFEELEDSIELYIEPDSTESDIDKVNFNYLVLLDTYYKIRLLRKRHYISEHINNDILFKLLFPPFEEDF